VALKRNSVIRFFPINNFVWKIYPNILWPEAATVIDDWRRQNEDLKRLGFYLGVYLLNNVYTITFLSMILYFIEISGRCTINFVL
jgi:hypothetical protein